MEESNKESPEEAILALKSGHLRDFYTQLNYV